MALKCHIFCALPLFFFYAYNLLLSTQNLCISLLLVHLLLLQKQIRQHSEEESKNVDFSILEAKPPLEFESRYGAGSNSCSPIVHIEYLD